jgi:hypothetical protein
LDETEDIACCKKWLAWFAVGFWGTAE